MFERKRRKERKRDCSPDCDIPGCDACLLSWIPLLGLPATLTVRSAPTLPARLGLAAIRGYQTGVSAHLPARCRYTPSCSAYAAEAVNRYGLKVGSQLTAARLRRCKWQVARGTADPVP